MNVQNRNPQDAGLVALLHQSRPAPPLPPRFQESVWRRIEARERQTTDEISSSSWLDVLVQRFLQPRWAVASLVMLIVAGGVVGAARSSAEFRHQAQIRYLSAVAPSSVH